MPRGSGSTAEWRAIARGPRVLHHILTRPDRTEEWTEEEFYALGRSDWEEFAHQWRHYWPELGGTCVEIGSGAGRMTHVLVEDFDRVEAVDVSEDMIARARERVPANVNFNRVDRTALPLDEESANAVFSVHVVQRHGRLVHELKLWRERRGLQRDREHSLVRFRAYKPETIHKLLVDTGFIDVELRMFPLRTSPDPHPFWLARRLAAD